MQTCSGAGQVDDPPRPRRAHVGDDCLGELEWGDHVAFERDSLLLRRHLGDRHGDRRDGVVDGYVDRSAQKFLALRYHVR